MIKFVIILVILLVQVPLCQSAEKEFYFFGGGGEPEGTTTVFDSHILSLSKFVDAKDTTWKSYQNFDGGHELTEKRLKTNLSKATSLGNFTQENYQKTLEDIENKLNSGKLEKGSQVLVVMSSHGAINSDGEKTHSVALSSKTGVRFDKISIDSLERISDLAAKKGVKLAIMDLSCFSGSSLKMANKHTCVITASGEHEYSYGEEKSFNENSIPASFGGRMLEAMKKGGNLEDAFLKARSGTIDPDFPMISTQTGLAVNKLIYDLVNPYLVYNQGHSNDFSKRYDPKNLDLDICDNKDQYDEINQRIDELVKLSNIPKGLIDAKKLKKALEGYRIYQNYYEKELTKTLPAGEEFRRILEKDYPKELELFDMVDGVTIAMANNQESLKMLEDGMSLVKDEAIKQKAKKAYDKILLKEKITKKILGKLSAKSQKDLKNFSLTLKLSDATTREHAMNVSIEAKKLYEDLYRVNINSQKNSKSNPCRDFVL